MPDKYRVICSENQNLYPEKIFVDIYPAGSMRPESCLTHDGLLQMRRLINPNIQKLESGIILTDFGHCNILLQREDALIRQNSYQKHLAEKRRELIERKAKEKYASAPQLLLAWKQAKYRGD